MDKIIQQGDVILKMRDALPANAKPMKPGARGYVLAEGEATGHAHCIKPIPGTEMFEVDGVLWLRVLASPSPQVHEEHRTQTVQPKGASFVTPAGETVESTGVFEVDRVVEVDPFENEVRVVTD